MLQLLASEKRLLDRLLAQSDDVAGSRKEELMPLVSQDYGRLQRLLSLGVLTVFQDRWRLHPLWVDRLSGWETVPESSDRSSTDLTAELEELRALTQSLLGYTDGGSMQEALSAYVSRFNQCVQRSLVWFDEVQDADEAAKVVKAWQSLQLDYLGQLWDWTPQLDRLLIALEETISRWAASLASLSKSRLLEEGQQSVGSLLGWINDARREGKPEIRDRMEEFLRNQTLSYWSTYRNRLFWPTLAEIPDQLGGGKSLEQPVEGPSIHPKPITPSLLSPEQGLLYRFVQDGHGQDLFSFMLEQPETADLSLADLQEWFGRTLQHAGDMVHIQERFLTIGGINVVEVRRIGEV